MRQVDRAEAEVSKFQKQLEESRNAGVGSREQAQNVNTQLTVGLRLADFAVEDVCTDDSSEMLQTLLFRGEFRRFPLTVLMQHRVPGAWG